MQTIILVIEWVISCYYLTLSLNIFAISINLKIIVAMFHT